MELVICKFRRNGGVNRYVFLIWQIVGLNPKSICQGWWKASLKNS
jgi:hypothetical protein